MFVVVEQCYAYSCDCLEQQQLWNKAAVYRDRHLQLAKEAQSMPDVAKAHTGFAVINLALGRFRCGLKAVVHLDARPLCPDSHAIVCVASEALASLESAYDSWELLKHERQMIVCSRMQAEVYGRLENPDKQRECRT